MDNSALNMAHYHSRRADSHLRHLRFEEAIESHRKAASAFDEILQMATNNTKIIESIKLQRDFQQKNIELVRLKKAQYEKYKQSQQRLKNTSFLEQRMAKDRIESFCDMQMSIFKTLEESDSLLDSLGISRTPVSASDGMKVTVDNTNDVKNKLDNTYESAHELEMLRDRVKTLEKDRNRKASLPLSNKSSDSSSEKSPTEIRRGSLTGEERLIVLPESSELPPLELPDFDYNF